MVEVGGAQLSEPPALFLSDFYSLTWDLLGSPKSPQQTAAGENAATRWHEGTEACELFGFLWRSGKKINTHAVWACITSQWRSCRERKSQVMYSWWTLPHVGEICALWKSWYAFALCQRFCLCCVEISHFSLCCFKMTWHTKLDKYYLDFLQVFHMVQVVQNRLEQWCMVQQMFPTETLPEFE